MKSSAAPLLKPRIRIVNYSLGYYQLFPLLFHQNYKNFFHCLYRQPKCCIILFSKYRNSFSTLRHLRYLVIDEADKLLDQHFNQWLPKILSSVKTDKTKRGSSFGGSQRSVSSLRDTMVGLCVSSERLQLMYKDDRRSKVIKITVNSYLLGILYT